MLLLALETSTAQGSIAIAEVEDSVTNLLFSKSWLRQKSHGELVTPAIEDALSALDLSIQNIDAFAVGIGPGSFTGIRVGLNTIKALAYSTDKPVYTFSSLELLAHSVPVYKDKTPLVALINAHKSQMYVSVFKNAKNGWRFTVKPKAMTVEMLEKSIRGIHFCVGEGYLSFSDRFSKKLKTYLHRNSYVSDYPSASTMVQIVSNKSKSLKPKSWRDLEALYIRGSEAEEKLRAGTLKPLPEF